MFCSPVGKLFNVNNSFPFFMDGIKIGFVQLIYKIQGNSV